MGTPQFYAWKPFKLSVTSYVYPRWQDRLTEYDYEIIHKPGIDHYMKLADGLSRLPSEYCTEFRGDLSDRLTMCLSSQNINEELDNAREDKEIEVRMTKEEKERYGRIKKLISR